MICKRLGIAAIVFIAAIIAYPVRSQMPSQTNPVLRIVDLELPNGAQINAYLNMPMLAISPDGKQFVCSTSEGLYLGSTDGSNARLLKGTREFILQPFFSPDGNWIGYFSIRDGKLKKIAIAGGKPENLIKIPVFRGASWSEDSSIICGVYDRNMGGRIMRISANGKNRETVLKLDSGKGDAYLPQMLPDGKSLLYTAVTGGRAQIVVKPLTAGVRKILLDGYGARYLPSGYIVYHLVDKNGVYAVPFDLAKLKVTGNPISIVNNVWERIHYSVSNSGTLVYIPLEDRIKALGRFTLVWVSRDGKEEPISAEPNTYAFPKISPDGTHVALTVVIGENQQICVWDLGRQSMIRLTSGEADNIDPMWSPDGKRLVYRSFKDPSNVTVNGRAADGTGEAEKIAAMPSGSHIFTWLKEGKELSPIPFQGKYNEEFFQVSPDRQWIAYASDESGQNEVYVRSLADANKGARQVSIRGGHSPLWSPDGRELFYRDADSVIAVPIETGPVFKTGTPKALFGRPYVSLNVGRTVLPMWDISPDGKRFLMMKASKTAEQMPGTIGPHKIRIVLNWPEALKNRPQEK